jgi:hypothetical protein
MTSGALFGCGPDHESLAAELAELVNGSWALTPGVHGVMIMPNGARVPSELPGHPSEAAVDWWHQSVTITLAPTRR